MDRVPNANATGSVPRHDQGSRSNASRSASANSAGATGGVRSRNNSKADAARPRNHRNSNGLRVPSVPSSRNNHKAR